MSPTDAPPTREAAWVRAQALFERVTGLERVIYSSIARAIVRRPTIPAGAKGFPYYGAGLSVLIAFIAASAIEFVVVDLIVQRWAPVRIVIDILSIWGLIWMIGLLCAHLMRPHTVGPDGVHVRDGLDLDVHVMWGDVDSVAIKKRRYEPKSRRITQQDGVRALAFTRHDETNIEVVLERPTALRLPGRPPKGGEQEVAKVSFWVDDPAAFLAAVRTHFS